MSTLVSQPETIIKPETPMPSPMVKPSSPDESSRMSNKATGFISPPLSSTSSEGPPKSPVQSKPSWPNSSNQWNVNNAPATGRYQAAQSYGPLARRQQQGPYALDRGDGTVSRLIPADELPFDIVGVPRREAPGSFSVVSGQPTQGPLYQAVGMDRGRVTSPQTGLGLSRVDYPSVMPYTPAINPALAPVYPTEAVQNAIDDIVSRPRAHQAQAVTRRQKIYCDKWLQTGNCGFQQVGCKFKHEMPMDRATQESVGLNGLPDWWTKTHGISLRPRVQDTRPAVSGRPGDKSWRNKEAEMGGMRAGMPSREFGKRPAAMPNRKPVPGTQQLQGPAESFASQLQSRLGGIALDATDRRTMTPGFSDIGSPLGAERRRDFGAIGDRPSSLSTSFPSLSRTFGSTTAGANHYAMLNGMAEKKFDRGGNLDDDSQSDYSGGITPF